MAISVRHPLNRDSPRMTILQERPKLSIVVTGSSSGIGEACALRMDRSGFRVFAGVRRHEDALALRSKDSTRLIPIILDVTDDASIKSAVDMVATVVGPSGLSGLVNNAGIVTAGPV